MRKVMIGRARSVDELESFDGNWVLSNSRSQQLLHDNHKNNKQLRIPTGNTMHAKSQGHLSERLVGSAAMSKASHPDLYIKREGKRGRSDYVTRRLRSNNRRNQSVDRPITSSTSSSGYTSSRENFLRPVPREVILHRSDGEFGFSMRQIPATLYGRKSASAFRSTARVPALQRLNCIDPGSLADRAGLKPGDYIIEVNQEYVACSTHQYVVHLIKSSPDALKLKVVEGAEESFRIHNHSTLPQHNNTSRFAPNEDTHTNSFIPRSHDLEPSYRRKSNGIPLQQLKLDSGGNQPRPTRVLAPHQTSNGLSPTVKDSPPTSKSIEAVVANIRLSRVADRDQIFYDSSQNQKTLKVSSQSRTATSGVQRIPSFSSVATNRSEPHAHDRNHRSYTGEILSQQRLHQTVSTGSVQEGHGTGNGKADEANWSGSSTDDSNHTYDKIRPVDVPFDTDEGYIRLGGNVDYVEDYAPQADVGDDQVDFLAMAEKARQMYLRTRAVSQTQ